jgi:hypothetical protein
VTAKDGQGQTDKKAAETRTASVARENADEAKAREDDKLPGTDAQGAALRAGSDATPERPGDTPDRQEGVDASMAPYPLYEEEDVESLRALGDSRGVAINRDVEKALLIKELRAKDRADGPGGPGPDNDTVASDSTNPYPSYDMMPLEELRSLASSRDLKLNPEDEKAHWVTELRAADSGVNNTGLGTTA